MHPIFQEAFRLRISSVVATAQTLGQLKHPGLIGQFREVLIRELLRPAMPSTIAFGTGKIVDHTGAESKQIDIVVYDTTLMPPLTYGVDDELGLFPVEACLYAIEVKSTLSAPEFAKAFAVASSLGALKYVQEFTAGGIPVSRVIPAVIALDSTMRSSRTEARRWEEQQAGHRDSIAVVDAQGGTSIVEVAPLRVACVFGRGYGYFDNVSPFRWRAATDSHDEVLGLIAGIANTVYGETARRRGLPFGHYLL